MNIQDIAPSDLLNLAILMVRNRSDTSSCASTLAEIFAIIAVCAILAIAIAVVAAACAYLALNTLFSRAVRRSNTLRP